MDMTSQQLVPGIVGISTYVDYAYQREMQSTARELLGTSGPINQMRSVTVTLDFHELVRNLEDGRLDAAEEQVAVAVVSLEAGGADFVVVTSGTTSTLTARARQRVRIGFLDLAEAAWSSVGARKAVGLLSTRRTVAGGMFDAAASRRGARLLVPPPDMAVRVDETIFAELVYGTVTDSALQLLGEALAGLAGDGAECVILGNTDMTLAVEQLEQGSPVPLIDSATAHARAAAHVAFRGSVWDWHHLPMPASDGPRGNTENL